MDIFKVIREGKSFLLFANLIMTAFQKRLGSQLGVKPGAEMLEAANAAERVNAELVLVDRDVKNNSAADLAGNVVLGTDESTGPTTC